MAGFFTRCATAACGVIVLTASCAQAQDIPGSFDQLRVIVKPGDIVTVTGPGGAMRGRILDLSSATLGLQVDGQRREMSMDDVQTITQTRHANLATGAKWGFGIGAGVAVIGYLVNGRRCDCLPLALISGAANGGMGAGIGVGIAAMMTSERAIFSSPGASARLNVQPVIGDGRRGLLLTARW